MVPQSSSSPADFANFETRQRTKSVLTDVGSSLHSMEVEIVNATMENLSNWSQGTWVGDSGDSLFSAHTEYVNAAIRAGISERPARLWADVLWPKTVEIENAKQKSDPGSRIHKGAPHYNAGMCFLLAGDLDRAVQFIAEAGAEDELLGRGSRGKVLVGDNHLSEEILIGPLVSCLVPKWEAAYFEITGCALDKGELKALLNWVSTMSREDAVQAVVALHRLLVAENGPENDALRHIRVQALTNLILLIESCLRKWSGGRPGQQLFDRMKAMTAVHGPCEVAFDAAHARFYTQFPSTHADKETHVGLNWAINDCLRAYGGASRVTRAGISCYMAVRLRNSLMHIIEGRTDLYTDKNKVTTLAAMMFSVTRLSRRGHEGTLSELGI